MEHVTEEQFKKYFELKNNYEKNHISLTKEEIEFVNKVNEHVVNCFSCTTHFKQMEEQEKKKQEEKQSVEQLSEEYGIDFKNIKHIRLKNGKEYYKVLVAQKTGSDKTIEEMIEISDRSIEKCLRKLIKLQKKYPNIINEYRNHKKNIKIVQNPQNILNKLRQKMVKYYPKAPKVSCKIKYVHKTMEEYTSPAFYMVPEIDSYKENVIYINKAQTAELYPTLAHEGYPGHLYQNVYYAARNDDPVRYLLDYPGYSEGYATYVEVFSYSMMDAEGYGDIYQQMNMEMYEYNLALCSRVDLGVHYEGWKKKDVRAYLRSFGMDDSQADELFQMIIENPANYLSYYIGYQEFHELLTDYKKMAGNKYSLKAYHTEILDAGPCSFDILRRRIESNL